MKKLMDFKEKEILFNSFIYTNFNYCPLVWHFCSSKSVYKTEKIQKRTLRLLHNDFPSNYAELLKKSGIATIEIKRLRRLAIEIFKTDSNLNPYYRKVIFSKTINLTHSNSPRSFEPHFWNSLPSKIKNERGIKNLRII